MQYNFEFIMAVLNLDEKKLKDLKSFISELNKISYECKYKTDLVFCNDIINYIKYKKKIRHRINKKLLEKYNELLSVLVLDEKIFKDIIYQVTFPNVRGFNNFYKLIDMFLSSDRVIIYKNVKYLLNFGFKTMNFITNTEVVYNVGLDTIINDGTVKGIISDGKKQCFTKTGNIISKKELIDNIYRNYNVHICDYNFVIKYIKNDKTGLFEIDLDINRLDFDYNLLKINEHGNLNIECDNQKCLKLDRTL